MKRNLVDTRRSGKSVWIREQIDRLLAMGETVVVVSITKDGEMHYCKVYPFKRRYK